MMSNLSKTKMSSNAVKYLREIRPDSFTQKGIHTLLHVYIERNFCEVYFVDFALMNKKMHKNIVKITLFNRFALISISQR